MIDRRINQVFKAQYVKKDVGLNDVLPAKMRKGDAFDVIAHPLCWRSFLAADLGGFGRF